MIDNWYLENLVDPVDKSKLTYNKGGYLVSDGGRHYPIVDGIPVMLIPDIPQSINAANYSIETASLMKANDLSIDELYINTLGISEAEKKICLDLHKSGNCNIDPVVLAIIGATSGYAYKHMIGNIGLTDYPIPNILIPDGNGELILDIGCNWGRWSISAARKGYQVVGIDPQLGAIAAAKRVAQKMGLNIRFICGDGRFLPFATEKFERVFSYSVLQHFSKADAKITINEISRVLKYEGESLIQMANLIGVRSLQHQFRRGFKNPTNFDVRYYTPWELSTLFNSVFKTFNLSADCYFGLGWQWADYKFMPLRYKLILILSNILQRISNKITPLKFCADSIYIGVKKIAV